MVCQRSVVMYFYTDHSDIEIYILHSCCPFLSQLCTAAGFLVNAEYTSAYSSTFRFIFLYRFIKNDLTLSAHHHVCTLGLNFKGVQLFAPLSKFLQFELCYTKVILTQVIYVKMSRWNKLVNHFLSNWHLF